MKKNHNKTEVKVDDEEVILDESSSETGVNIGEEGVILDESSSENKAEESKLQLELKDALDVTKTIKNSFYELDKRKLSYEDKMAIIDFTLENDLDYELTAEYFNLPKNRVYNIFNNWKKRGISNKNEKLVKELIWKRNQEKTRLASLEESDFENDESEEGVIVTEEKHKYDDKTFIKLKKYDIRIRISKFDDIILVKKLEKRLEAKGEKLSSYIRDLLIENLENDSRVQIFKDFNKQILQMFHKALYSRTSGITRAFNKRILPVGLDSEIMNKKLDIILNSLLGNVKLTDYSPNNLPDKAFEEIILFETHRNEAIKILEKKFELNLSRDKKLLISEQDYIDEMFTEVGDIQYENKQAKQNKKSKKSTK
ncbi:Mbov_0398 family ICE element protein [Mycoplasmopsis agassizii]|uniref:Uncharacterized protein n=1 Tax=Mycoplasmopsis agassizii TaxID=33922 RepID=A0ABX4H647_9BACT|nr:hypothetical protein [Mycoplasmopsis agassizii]PAF55365.1 hypothetical protein CJF60_01595 [Mycoplasmopsis agassizii]SMC20182.1 hypothetical protein SAMN02745179_01005 [Mycoplasmopsis agassizii]